MPDRQALAAVEFIDRSPGAVGIVVALAPVSAAAWPLTVAAGVGVATVLPNTRTPDTFRGVFLDGYVIRPNRCDEPRRRLSRSAPDGGRILPADGHRVVVLVRIPCLPHAQNLRH